jgi:hypothetical protein
MADNGDQVALPASFHPQHAEAVIGVVEGRAVDQAGQTSVGLLAFRVCGDGRMMADRCEGATLKELETLWQGQREKGQTWTS